MGHVHLSSHRRITGALPSLVATALLLGALGLLGPAAGAVDDAGAGPLRESPADGYPPPPPGTYVAPVDRPVADPFRLPDGQYGAGNRGLEYRTRVGDPVRAIGAGRVLVAREVVGRLVVTVLHPDGRRSSLTGLRSLRVAGGDVVARGTPIGTAGPGLHLGLREGERYVDPAPFLTSLRRHAVLVAPEPAG